jgi:4-oxalocrotonate tautomerase
MPYVNVQITKGATREQKASLVKEMTASLSKILGKKTQE